MQTRRRGQQKRPLKSKLALLQTSPLFRDYFLEMNS